MSAFDLDVREIVGVLVGVGSFVFEGLDELVETGCKNGSQHRADPVNPVIAVKVPVDECWPKRSGRVQTAAGEVHANQLGNKQRETNTNRGNKGSSVLLGSQHEDGKDKLSGQEHLDEESLHYSRASTKCCLYRQRSREHAGDECCRSYATENLNNKQQDTTKPGNGTDKAHANGDGGIEESTRDTEKDPSIDRQRESKTQCDVLQLLWIATGLRDAQARRRGNVVRNLCSSQGEEEEEHGAHVFTAHGDEVVSNSIGQSSNERDALSAVIGVYLFPSRWIGRFGEGKSEYCPLQRVVDVHLGGA